MPAPELDYSKLLERARERALRWVMQDALQVVADHGLPDGHHFYITFRTDHPGVVLDEALRARYPTEMTIVLEYEFWGLEVAPDGFSVTLSFNNVGQRLQIPFEAVRVFADPSVDFGFQFTVAEGAVEDQPAPVDELSPAAPAAPSLPEVAPTPDEAAAEPGSAEVLTLDRFRKKIAAP